MHVFSSKCMGRLMLGLRKSHLLYIAALFVLMVAMPFRASAQNATIVGTVTDPSGSVIANVKVSLTHVETGHVTALTTNDSGQYVAVDLPIGHYNIKAEATGFKVAEQKNLILQVGDRSRVDFQMTLGGSSSLTACVRTTTSISSTAAKTMTAAALAA